MFAFILLGIRNRYRRCLSVILICFVMCCRDFDRDCGEWFCACVQLNVDFWTHVLVRAEVIVIVFASFCVGCLIVSTTLCLGVCHFVRLRVVGEVCVVSCSFSCCEVC